MSGNTIFGEKRSEANGQELEFIWGNGKKGLYMEKRTKNCYFIEGEGTPTIDDYKNERFKWEYAGKKRAV